MVAHWADTGCTEPVFSADNTGNDRDNGVVTSHWPAVGQCKAVIAISRGRCGELAKHLGELVEIPQMTPIYSLIIWWVLSKHVDTDSPDVCTEEMSIPEWRRV